MRTKTSLAISALAFGTMASLVLGLVEAGEKSIPSVSARLSTTNRVVVRASGRGNPYVNLSDGTELSATGQGALEMQGLLEPNASQPRALASADFDEDGVPDLICVCAREGGGVVILYRGNIDSIFPNSPEAQRRKTEGTFTDSAFLSPARVFEVPIAGDFVGAGDFDADGHWDLVIAARNWDELWRLSGDGKGSFGAAQNLGLPGRVTSLVTGEINRADGLTDIGIGVVGDDGAKALVFEGPEGALKAEPEVFSLAAASDALAIGELDGDYPMDLAVGAGSELVIIHGRDRKLSFDETRKAKVPRARVDRRSFGFEIRSIAEGDFSGANVTSLALLASDGTVHLAGTREQGVTTKAATKKAAAKKGSPASSEVLGQWPGGQTAILRASVHRAC